MRGPTTSLDRAARDFEFYLTRLVDEHAPQENRLKRMISKIAPLFFSSGPSQMTIPIERVLDEFIRHHPHYITHRIDLMKMQPGLTHIAVRTLEWASTVRIPTKSKRGFWDAATDLNWFIEDANSNNERDTYRGEIPLFIEHRDFLREFVKRYPEHAEHRYRLGVSWVNMRRFEVDRDKWATIRQMCDLLLIMNEAVKPCGFDACLVVADCLEESSYYGLAKMWRWFESNHRFQVVNMTRQHEFFVERDSRNRCSHRDSILRNTDEAEKRARDVNAHWNCDLSS